jgi:hypothetical protein
VIGESFVDVGYMIHDSWAKICIRAYNKEVFFEQLKQSKLVLDKVSQALYHLEE